MPADGHLRAGSLKADMLLMLTDVDAVYRGLGTQDARGLGHVSCSDVSGDRFPAGSMAPKVATGKLAAIGRLEDAVQIVEGLRGTWLEADGRKMDRESRSP